MIMLLRKLVNDQHERWIYASMIVIAANAGGAWSPIGDVTTIMLWVNGNVTTAALMTYVFLPSVAALVIPLLFVTAKLKGELPEGNRIVTRSDFISPREKKTIFFLGVGGLIFVPIFKAITHMPPFVGILFVLSILWIFTEIMYNHKMLEKAEEHRVPQVISRIDMPRFSSSSVSSWPWPYWNRQVFWVRLPAGSTKKCTMFTSSPSFWVCSHRLSTMCPSWQQPWACIPLPTPAR